MTIVGGADVSSVLASELGRTPAAVLDRALARESDTATAVGSVLRECLWRNDPALHGDALIGPLEDGWRAWLADEALVSVKARPTYEILDVGLELGSESLSDHDLCSADGCAALDEVMALVSTGVERRADVSAVLAPRIASARGRRDDATCRDLGAHRRVVCARAVPRAYVWYARGRYRALAGKHGCVCSLEDRPWLPALSVEQALLGLVAGKLLGDPALGAWTGAVLRAALKRFSRAGRTNRSASVCGFFTRRGIAPSETPQLVL